MPPDATLPSRDIAATVPVLPRDGHDLCSFVLTPMTRAVKAPISCPGRGLERPSRANTVG